MKAQTKQCLGNIKKVLSVAESSLDDVAKLQVFLAKADDWASMNEVYKEYFSTEHPPLTTIVLGEKRPFWLQWCMSSAKMGQNKPLEKWTL